MRLEKITNNSTQKLSRILETLKSEYSIELDLDNPVVEEKTARAVIETLKSKLDFSEYHNSPRFVKSTLVLEAIKIAKTLKSKKESKKTIERKPMKKKIIKENSEIEKAELLLASKNIVDDLQNMIEDIGKMQVQKIPPIVDRIKVDHGLADAAQYREQSLTLLQGVMDSLQTAKDGIDNLTMVLGGEANMSQFDQPLDLETPLAPSPEETDITPEPEVTGPAERERKEESIKSKKPMLKESPQKVWEIFVQRPGTHEVRAKFKVNAPTFQDAVKQAKEMYMRSKSLKIWNDDLEILARPVKAEVAEDIVEFPKDSSVKELKKDIIKELKSIFTDQDNIDLNHVARHIEDMFGKRLSTLNIDMPEFMHEVESFMKNKMHKEVYYESMNEAQIDSLQTLAHKVMQLSNNKLMKVLLAAGFKGNIEDLGWIGTEDVKEILQTAPETLIDNLRNHFAKFESLDTVVDDEPVEYLQYGNYSVSATVSFENNKYCIDISSQTGEDDDYKEFDSKEEALAWLERKHFEPTDGLSLKESKDLDSKAERDAKAKRVATKNKNVDRAKLALAKNELEEAWNTKMKTKPSEKGKWEGWTKAELEAKLTKLKKKKEHSAEDTKEIRQINFALRAKGHGKSHTGRFGKVSESHDYNEYWIIDIEDGREIDGPYATKNAAKADLQHFISEYPNEDWDKYATIVGRGKKPKIEESARNVYLNKKLIDTVFFDDKISDEEVKKSLIDHDGYEPTISVVTTKVKNTTESKDSFTRQDIEKMLSDVNAKLQTQGNVVDDRLLSKKTQLEKLLKTDFNEAEELSKDYKAVVQLGWDKSEIKHFTNPRDAKDWIATTSKKYKPGQVIDTRVTKVNESTAKTTLVVETVNGKKGQKTFVTETDAKKWLKQNGHNIKSAIKKLK